MAIQKATISVTASCLQKVILFHSCTISAGWLDWCFPHNSQSKPATKYQITKALHLSLQDFGHAPNCGL